MAKKASGPAKPKPKATGKGPVRNQKGNQTNPLANPPASATPKK